MTIQIKAIEQHFNYPVPSSLLSELMHACKLREVSKKNQQGWRVVEEREKGRCFLLLSLSLSSLSLPTLTTPTTLMDYINYNDCIDHTGHT